MTRNRKFFTIGAVFAFVLMSVAVFAAQQQATNATLSFSGIHIVENEISSSPQGFIDISLKNIETPGLSFCFEYDKRYIQLSDADTNQVIEAPTGINDNNHKYFKQNTEAFPIDSFVDDNDLSNSNLFRDPIHPMVIGTAKLDRSCVIMTFIPQSESSVNSEYIEYKSVDEDGVPYEQPVILADKTQDGVSFGQISFRVVDPVGLARLSEDELKDIVKIVPFSTMLGDDITTEDDIINKFGLHMSYYIYPVENFARLEWYPCTEKNIEYNMGIDADLISVEPQNTEFTVSAYDIYNTGDVEDLFRYLNEKASVLTLKYADGTQFPASFQWNSRESSVNWDPKGGTYTVEQPFNENVSVTVTVNVTPVSLVDFDFDNENITYCVDMEGFPQTLDDLQLPKAARPVLDAYTPNCGLPEIQIDWYRIKDSGSELTALPDGFGVNPPETYEIEGVINNINDSLSVYPWLTVPDPAPTIIANRYVVASADEMPKAIEAEAVTDDNGVMTVTVKNTDDSPIPEGTTFTVKMPGGQKIDDVGTRYIVTVNGDGPATIVFDPDIGNPDEQLLARLINLGSRAGEFSIASEEPSKFRSEYVSFTSNPRKNYYLPSDDTGNTYEFDYSREMSAMLPIQAGELPPTTITLIDNVNGIKTTYNGYDGNEEGMLKTFTVDSWDTVSGDPATAGSVVEIEGVLSDTSYTNYGEVTNKDGIKVKIKYLAAEKIGEDTIENINDFVFDPKEVGYDYDEIQTHTFTIHNTGNTDIYGLSAVIALSTVTDDEESNAEAFLLERAPIGLLEKNARTEFDISTKYGLPVGKYVSTVSIYSNNKLLDSFTISFEVTAEPVYKIILKADPPDFGKAETLTKTYTAKKGDIITILATANTDCEFVNWTTTNKDISFSDDEEPQQAVTMPDNDIEITAHFKETVVARLRAAEMYVKDANYENASDPSEPFYDSKWKYIDYDPITNEYYVAVPNEMEKVKLWFKPKEDDIEEKTTTLTHTHGETSVTLAEPTVGDNDYYISEAIELDLSPVDNVVKLKFEYDDPDDGHGTKEYTIHIFRKLTAAEMVEFNYGNSPYGLIMRDDSITAENKDAVKQEFKDNGYQFKDTVPQGAEKGVVYTPEAWINDNYDESDTALFVTDCASFTDPGYNQLKTSIGTDVVDGNVTRTVSVYPLLATDDDRNGTIDDFNDVSREPQTITLNVSSSGEITSLIGRRIRPDTYMMTYTFTDFDGQRVSVSKPLIILSKLGDVNISDGATADDVSAITNRFTDLLADEVSVTGYASGGRLFRYRICDANKDGFINAVDANFIRANKLNPFYKNVTQGGVG